MCIYVKGVQLWNNSDRIELQQSHSVRANKKKAAGSEKPIKHYVSVKGQLDNHFMFVDSSRNYLSRRHMGAALILAVARTRQIVRRTEDRLSSGNITGDTMRGWGFIL